MKTLTVFALLLIWAMPSMTQETRQQKKAVLATPQIYKKAEAQPAQKKAIALSATLPEQDTPAPDTRAIADGTFNAAYPNFYVFRDNQFWPLNVLKIQYEPRSSVNVASNDKRMTIQVYGETAHSIYGEFNGGPPIYETSDLKFYEDLFRSSKDYVIVFDFTTPGNFTYYHKSLVPDLFNAINPIP